MASTKKFEDLDITNDEAKRLTEAFKNEEFRKLFMEYAEEIQDPENRKRYEAELAEMEGQKGMDVKFVHPEPGYVIKTSVDGTAKAFINICQNEHVGKPSFERGVNPQTGQIGQTWSIPHSLAPPREDLDKSGSRCKVFDVVFHPDTFRMGQSNARFGKMINDTALTAVERQFTVTLDKSNLKFPKIKFKGQPQATIIRSRKKEPQQNGSGEGCDKGDGRDKELVEDVISRLPYPYGDKTSKEKADANEQKALERDAKRAKTSNKCEESGPTVPTYTITHRSDLDFQEYTYAPDAKSSTRPKELVVAVDLPLLKSASSVNLDIFEKRLLLESTSPAKYKLDLNLPYPVDESNGSAKFDKSKKKLMVTLPVLKVSVPSVPFSSNSEVAHEEEDEDEIPDLEDDVPDEVNNPSLIEVISSTESPETSSPKSSDGTEQSEKNYDDSSIEVVEHKNAYNAECQLNGFNYQLPNYSASQDWETTSFVLNVKNVKRDSMKKCFVKNGVQVKFVSVGSGGFPMHYSFMVKFDEINTVETAACDVSISEENAVIVLGKSSEAAGMWENFHVGIDADHLEEALFVTEKTLSSALDQLDVNTMPLNNNEKVPDLEVTQMNDDHLTIQLSNVKEKHQRSKKFSESSDDIEVVHTSGLPQLHSILKDRSRTVSESSDEAFSNRGPYRREDSVSSIFSTGSASEGIVSESEEGATPTRKKSVSFSEHVDQTTYKCNSSVSALHASLKKKNKRYRKKEAKIERRRRRSSGSEHEHSSEEQSSQPESSEVDLTDDTSKDDDDDVIIDHRPEPLPEETKTELEEDDENDVATKQTSKKSKKNKRKNKGKKAKEVPSEAHAASHAPPETRKNDASEESESAAETVSSPDGERTNGVVAVSEGKVNGDGVELHVGSNGNSDNGVAAGEECDSDDGESTLDANRDKDKERTNEKPKGKDGDKPETVLNWEEGPVDASDVTKCAFSFSNSIMYELDED